MDAEYLIGNRDHPIDKRRFLEIGHSIEARRNPVTGVEHISSDLRLHRIDVVHERRRREDTTEVDRSCEKYNDPKELAAAYNSAVSTCLLKVSDGVD